jgi:hypothetical protein
MLRPARVPALTAGTVFPRVSRKGPELFSMGITVSPRRQGAKQGEEAAEPWQRVCPLVQFNESGGSAKRPLGPGGVCVHPVHATNLAGRNGWPCYGCGSRPCNESGRGQGWPGCGRAGAAHRNGEGSSRHSPGNGKRLHEVLEGQWWQGVQSEGLFVTGWGAAATWQTGGKYLPAIWARVPDRGQVLALSDEMFCLQILAICV